MVRQYIESISKPAIMGRQNVRSNSIAYTSIFCSKKGQIIFVNRYISISGILKPFWQVLTRVWSGAPGTALKFELVFAYCNNNLALYITCNLKPFKFQ